MRIASEYGQLTTELEDIVNRRLRDGWFLLGPPAVAWPDANVTGNVPYAVFTFCDEPPYDNWVGRNGVQRVGATWEA